MKTSTKSIIIITSCLLAAGLLLLTAGLIMGGSPLKQWPGDISQALNGKVENYQFDSGEGAEPFHTVHLDAVRAEVVIKRGDSFRFRYEFKNTYYVPEYSLNNGTLIIRETKNSNNWPSWAVNYSGVIEVTIPEGAQVDKIICDNVSGSVDVNSLSADSVSINSVSGGVKINVITAKSLTIETVSGAIMAEQANAARLNLESVSGSITYTGEAVGDIEASSVSGRISLKGKLLGDITIGQVSGSVEFETSEPASAYSGEFSSISGRIKINDEDRGKNHWFEGSGNSLNIDTVSGGAELNFGV